MLIGEYRHTIDDKNRLSLPAKFRKEMGKTVVVTPGLDSCLFVFTAKSWERLSASLSDSSVLSADRRQLNRYLLGGATEVPVDGAGRMLLSEHLREWGKLQSKVVVIGVRDRVEIWDESLWQTYRDNAAKNAEAVAEKLSSVGMI
jgi:MraZ protein